MGQKCLQIALALFFLASPARAQGNPLLPDRTPPGSAHARITGVVLRAETGEPFPGVRVTLQKHAGSENDPSLIDVVSDERGRFEIRALEPGDYSLLASKNGYCPQWLGSKPGKRRTPIKLAAGETRNNVEFRLSRGGVISGRIRDALGQPLIGGAVFATLCCGRAGQVFFAQTDDRGEYRIYGLPRGEYLVGAGLDSDLSALDKNQEHVVATTYYPDVLMKSGAVPVDVQRGQEVTGIDIDLKRTAVYQVEGVVLDGRTGKPVRGVSLTAGSTSASASGAENFTSSTDETGGFVIQGVAPGTVRILAHHFEIDANGPHFTGKPNFKMVSASLTINVATHVRGLRLWLQPLPVIRGLVRLDGKPAAQVKVALTGPSSSQYDEVVTDAKGEFEFANVTPDDATISAPDLQEDCFLKSVTLNGADISNGFTIPDSGTQAPVILEVSSKGSRIGGRVVLNDEKPAPGATIVLVPAGENVLVARIREVTAGPTGLFEFKGVSPGEYLLYAWHDLDEDLEIDTQFIRQFKSQATSTRVAERSTQVVTLKAIAAPNSP